jgi:hypothetical protein
VSRLEPDAVHEIRSVIDSMSSFLASVPVVFGPDECEDVVRNRIPRWLESLRGALIPPPPPGGLSPGTRGRAA